MITDQELDIKIEEALKNYSGYLDHFYEAVGMVMTGRLLGWRVMRLVSSRRCWMMAVKLFGDPKELMPERGKYYYKSRAMKVIDEFGNYWPFISGAVSRDFLPNSERRMIE